MENKIYTVAITGAAGQVCSYLLNFICSGKMFGPDVKFNQQLIELPFALEVLKGVIEEQKDLACPNMVSVFGTADTEKGFENADIILQVGAMPRGPNMTRGDLISKNANIFKAQGEVQNKVGKKDSKICVVGNPANINATILSRYAPNIPKKNISCLTRLDQNRLYGQIRDKFPSSQKIQNGIIWGNHSISMLVDSTNCTVDGVKLTDCMKEEDKVWLESLQDKVSKRGAEIIELKKMSSTFSAAYAICDHIRDWIYGTKDGEWASMGVFPEKDCYGLPEDIVFSLPCILKDHSVEIVKNLELNENSKAKMQDNVNEIVEQLKIGQEVLEGKTS